MVSQAKHARMKLLRNAVSDIPVVVVGGIFVVVIIIMVVFRHMIRQCQWFRHNHTAFARNSHGGRRAERMECSLLMNKLKARWVVRLMYLIWILRDQYCFKNFHGWDPQSNIWYIYIAISSNRLSYAVQLGIKKKYSHPTHIVLYLYCFVILTTAYILIPTESHTPVELELSIEKQTLA